MTNRPKSIFRADKSRGGFTIIANATLRDRRLSFRARGVLACLLSNEDDWEVVQASLESEGTEGREAIRSAMNELERFGYVKKERARDGKGRLKEYRWMICEIPTQPNDGNPSLGVDSPNDGNTACGLDAAKNTIGGKKEEEEAPPIAVKLGEIRGRHPATWTNRERQAWKDGTAELEITLDEAEILAAWVKAKPRAQLDDLGAFLRLRHEQLAKAIAWKNSTVQPLTKTTAQPRAVAASVAAYSYREGWQIEKDLQREKEALSSLRGQESNYRYIDVHPDPEVPAYSETKKVMRPEAKEREAGMIRRIAELRDELCATDPRKARS